MALTLVVGKAVQAKLVAANISAVFTRIHAEGMVPAKVTLPYIVHGYAGGGDPSLTVGRGGDLFWQVQAVSDNKLTAEQIGDAIDSALHYAALTLDAGWHLGSIRRDTPISFTEEVERRQYHHAGWTFRVRLWADS